MLIIKVLKVSSHPGPDYKTVVRLQRLLTTAMKQSPVNQLQNAFRDVQVNHLKLSTINGWAFIRNLSALESGADLQDATQHAELFLVLSLRRLKHLEVISSR